MKDFLEAVRAVLLSPKSLIVSVFGVFLYTLGINLFITPANLFPIGTMGLVYEISFILDKFGITLQADIGYFLLNIPILILGYFKVGKKFTVKTLIVVAFTSVFMSAIPVPDAPLMSDTLLAIIASALISGVGVALLLRVGASSGGTDIIALYMSIAKGKSFGTFNTAFNGIVIAIAVILTKDLTTAIYLLIYVYILSVTIDKIHNSGEKFTMIIVTSMSAEVKQSLFGAGVRRGITVIDSKGGYTGNPNRTLLITCERNEYPEFTRMIKEVDPKAFISTFKTQDVVGEFENTYLKTL
ncbi:YitT family protein [Mollicutes bacterium LVI A0078]|nr:YitT family protein [Mollicutes bacterium LVI A0075]WOO90696.1 YitT family protein [Mollicutes bacterium LVI A0078]